MRTRRHLIFGNKYKILQNQLKKIKKYAAENYDALDENELHSIASLIRKYEI